MTWQLIYNRSNGEVAVSADRTVPPAEFTYGDDTDPRVIKGVASGELLVVTISFDPNGSPTGIDPEAFLAAGEVLLRNGGSWTPPEPPVNEAAE